MRRDAHQGREPPSQAALVPMARHETRQLLRDHLRYVALGQLGTLSDSGIDREYISNMEFWVSVLSEDTRAFHWVCLDGFRITDWFPRAPGTYHTPWAEGQRTRALSFVEEEDGVQFFSPRGKSNMVLGGGVGSVRFKPVRVDGEHIWLGTATSDGYCDSGVPIGVPDRLMKRLYLGGIYRLLGQLRFLPDILSDVMAHVEEVPLLYLVIDSAEELANPGGGAVVISPAVFFTSEESDRRRREEQLVTYVSCHAGPREELDEAIAWLEWYIDRYRGRPATNFDEQRRAFAGAPFSLQRLSSGRLDAHELERLNIENATVIVERVAELKAKECHMTDINVKFGDNNEFHGPVVVARLIRDSFNSVQEGTASPELKSHLEKLSAAVGRLCEHIDDEAEAEQVARDLKTLVDEANSSKPRKNWWGLALEGLKQAAKAAGEIGKPVLELLPLILPLLAAA